MKRELKHTVADRLTSLSDGFGRNSILAIDHGKSLDRRLHVARGSQPSVADVIEVKLDILSVLGPLVDAVVLDPGPVLEHAVRRGLIPAQTGVVAGLPDIDGAGVRAVARLRREVGAVEEQGHCDAVKFCFQVENQSDLSSFANVAERGAQWCHDAGLALVVELVTAKVRSSRYGTGALDPHGHARFVKAFAGLGADLLKVEFPTSSTVASPEDSLEACAALTKAAGTVPWTLLSSGANFELFERQVAVACRGGASGFIAGTAIWQEVVDRTDAPGRTNFLETTGAERTSRLRQVVRTGVATNESPAEKSAARR